MAQSRKIFRKVLKGFLYFLLGIFCLVLLVLIFINLPVGKRVVKNQIVSYLENKLHNKVSIDKLDYSLPKWVELNGIYVEDLNKDTLLYGEQLKVDLGMLKLISGNTDIKRIALTNIVAKINRAEKDSFFNFQFIVDAFAPNPNPNAIIDTSALKLTLDEMILSKVRLKFDDYNAGSQMRAYIDTLHLTTNKFQPDRMKFLIDEMSGNGINFSMTTYKAAVPAPAVVLDTTNTQDYGLFVIANKFLLQNSIVNVHDSITGLHYDHNIKTLGLTEVFFNMNQSVAKAKSIYLDSSKIAFTQPKLVRSVIAKDTIVPATAPWLIQLDELGIRGSSVRYDDMNVARAGGLDFAHLDADNVNALVTAFKFSKDTTRAVIDQFAFKDKGGFKLDSTHAVFVMTDTALFANELYIKTPQSLIRKAISMRYDSLVSITTSPKTTLVNVLLPNSRIAFNDLYLLSPALKTSLPPSQFANQTIDLNTELRGNLQRLYIPYFQLVGLSGSKINARGTVYNVADPERLRYDLEIISSRILKKDLVKFVPAEQQSMIADLPSVIDLRGKFTGTTNDIVADLTVSGKDLNFSGVITASNFSDPANLKYGADFRNLALTKKLIEGFVPPEALASINLPERLSAKGKLKGNTQNIDMDLQISSSYGNAALKGYLNNMQNPEAVKYDMALSTGGFNMGALLKQDSTLGVMAGNFVAKGTGFDYKTMRSSIKADINSIDLMQYNYKNIVLNAQLNNGNIDAKGRANDPNLQMDFDILANVKGDYPTAQGYLRIDTANLQNLKLYDSLLNMSGTVLVDAKNLRPRNLDASLLIDSLRIRLSNGRYIVDTVSLLASSNNGIDSIKLRSPFARFTAGGAFDYDKVGTSIAQYVNGYYNLPGFEKNLVPIPNQQVAFEGALMQAPIISGFVPGLKTFKDITFDGSYSSDYGDSALAFNTNIPYLVYEDYVVREGKLNVNAKNEQLLYKLKFDTLDIGKQKLYGTFAQGFAARDSIKINARTQDDKAKDWFGLAGTAAVSGETYSFTMQDSLILNYEKWDVAGGNYISYGPKGILVNNFKINNDTASIAIASQTPVPNSPIDITVKNFDLETVSSLVSGDTILVSGVLGINAVVTDLEKALPGFTGTATVRNLAVMQTPIGDIDAEAHKITDNNIEASLALLGNNNDIKAAGNYYLNNTEKQFDATLDVEKLSMKTVQGLSMGQLINSRGNIRGNFTASGKIADPRWKGQLSFDTTKIVPTMLGTPFYVDKQTISFDYPGIKFNKFTVEDSLKHKLTIDGGILINSMTEQKLNLDFKANDFVIVNSRQLPESQVYGFAAVDLDIKLRGTGVAPDIQGNIFVEDKSDLTLVLPESNYLKNDGLGIVRFIDRDTFDINPPVIDFVPANEDNNAFAKFLNYNLTLEINKAAKFSILLDPITGDNVQMQGDARLNIGVDPGGNLILAGVYNLDRGFYDFNYQFINRKFELQKGSRITFAGEPLDAVADLTAYYIANTSPQELVGNEVTGTTGSFGSALNQKLPFEVALNLTGKLSKPKITFAVRLPEEGVNINSDIRSTVDAKLAQLADDEAATNKQVFSLLLFGRFVGESSSDFFKGNGGGGFADIARQSVSQFLSEALNEIAGDVIKGVDIDLNLNSYNDYGSGNGQARTDLNVALSKNFLNDRLKVTVGNSFGVEGQDAASQAGSNTGFKPDITLAYSLTKDGRYLLRAYTKNQYEVTVDGFVVETGLSFVVTLDYEKFRELFQSKKKKK